MKQFLCNSRLDHSNNGLWIYTIKVRESKDWWWNWELNIFRQKISTNNAAVLED